MFESKYDLRDYAERAIRTSQTICSLDPQTVLRDFPLPRNEVTQTVLREIPYFISRISPCRETKSLCKTHVPRVSRGVSVQLQFCTDCNLRDLNAESLGGGHSLHPSPYFSLIRVHCQPRSGPPPAPITDCSPARPGGPWLVPPCSPSPAPPKSAPGGCLSESITVYSLVHRTPLR